MWSSRLRRPGFSCAALAALLFAACCAFASTGQTGQPSSPRGSLGWQCCSSGAWGSYGQLSHEQQQALQRIYGEYSGRLYELRSLIYAKKAELNALLSKSRIDTAAIENLVSELNELRSELLATQVEMVMEMRQNGLPFFGWGEHVPVPGLNRSW